MSQDKYVYLSLHFHEIDGIKSVQKIKVAENEYKEMLKTLRMWDEPKQYWLQDVLGVIYNMNKVSWFQEIEGQTYKDMLDTQHLNYLKKQGLI